jgi:phosphatidylglycerol---prolipoprotein diacylglyceryl transferase
VNPESYYIHRISPFIIRFTENFGIRWYGLSYIAGFIVALLLLRYLSSKRRLKLSLENVEPLLTSLIIGVLIGARIGYVLFYDLPLLYQFEPGFPFWGVLAINQGGMSSHGGFLGVAIVLLVFSKRHKIPLLHLGDTVVMVAAPGLFFGRMANFINGELYGRATDVSWAICFPQEILTWPGEKIINLLDYMSEKGFEFSGVGPLLNSVISNDTVANLLHPFLTPRHPSQLYEAFLEGIILFLILWFFGLQSKKAGQASAVFFWAYAILRIMAEQFREPDYNIGYQWLNLTRGQWLSFFMIIAGAVLWYISLKQNILIENIKIAEKKPPSTKKKKRRKSK